MPSRTRPAGAGQHRGLAAELIGRPILLRPVEDRVLPTALGDAAATVCRLIVLDDQADTGSPAPQRRGLVPVFWTVVREQLRQLFTAESPWVPGQLSRPGRAYRLTPITARQRSLLLDAASALGGRP